MRRHRIATASAAPSAPSSWKRTRATRGGWRCRENRRHRRTVFDICDEGTRRVVLGQHIVGPVQLPQVLEAWGSPNTMNVTHTSDGLRREEWIFEDWESPAVVKHRYLYFEEGKLIGGHFSGSDVRLPLPAAPEMAKPKGHP